MENLTLLLQWLFFALLICAGLLTMRVIKNEKKNYLKDPQEIYFKYFKLLTPRWWGLSSSQIETPDEIIFKRLDTRYDWEARFIWSEKKSDKDIIELFKEKIFQRKILFDEDHSVIHNPSDFEEKDFIKSGRFEMVRLEGPATFNAEERLYYDAYLIRELKTGYYLYAESRSSILNGLVEGPYFEEVMLRLEILN